jgi:hypothetical protein
VCRDRVPHGTRHSPCTVGRRPWHGLRTSTFSTLNGAAWCGRAGMSNRPADWRFPAGRQARYMVPMTAKRSPSAATVRRRREKMRDRCLAGRCRQAAFSPCADPRCSAAHQFGPGPANCAGGGGTVCRVRAAGAPASHDLTATVSASSSESDDFNGKESCAMCAVIRLSAGCRAQRLETPGPPEALAHPCGSATTGMKV